VVALYCQVERAQSSASARRRRSVEFQQLRGRRRVTVTRSAMQRRQTVLHPHITQISSNAGK